VTEEKGVVKYKAKDGQEISLEFETVRSYLVQGDRDLVTPQELMFFMGMCKSRGLNPFKKDAYLIKYAKDPAAIVVSIDYFRARARAQKDCRGWKAGVLIQKNGNLEKREGSIVLEGEKLVGGWFEAKPEGWTEPRFHSVNLKGYIKKTREGNITRFWSEDNQPSQIMKVAESQGLRIVWPDEFQQLYSEEEINAHRQSPDDGMGLAAAEKERREAIEKFHEAFPFAGKSEALDEFLNKLAQANRCTIEDIKVEAIKKLAEFRTGFEEYEKLRGVKTLPPVPDPPSGDPPQADPPPAPDHATADTAISDADRKREQKIAEKRGKNKPLQEMVECPEYGKHHGRQVAVIYCQTQCDNKRCALSPARERQPGEDDE